MLLISLVLMLMPYSVPMQSVYMSGEERVINIKTYAYFSPYPALHYNCTAFISAIACAAAVIIAFLRLIRNEKCKADSGILFVTFISMIASAVTFLVCQTLFSGLITCVLFSAFVLSFGLKRLN